MKFASYNANYNANITRYIERKYNTLYGMQKNVHVTQTPDTTRNTRYTKRNAKCKMHKT